ncbi:hypothetical protein TWF569_002909 [Orbilia oligospora]|uniref:C3H1-type domain-containing protein n=1 Tax=Orbilia oligospora TaxID=2813651 RepID=A0A7C8NAM7_ORBOL|nr:hypothetical protein TWF706_007461 [Orbilia oligospora]KAF3111498.1 hypothetical protein TWF102_007160 [Orbilia oligospora]KAF3117325.1 hypothetical protein TWF103_007465 [Orbilia oligospora]KAF3140739.1 hypothetical protein TWF594_006240 [Orbilia oligospora]KAF3152602.1 hypothetical protein TWF569_002909 [Orbilia oligospora]
MLPSRRPQVCHYYLHKGECRRSWIRCEYLFGTAGFPCRWLAPIAATADDHPIALHQSSTPELEGNYIDMELRMPIAKLLRPRKLSR